MASLPPYLRVISTTRSSAGIDLEIEVLRWHPSWWAYAFGECWRAARAYGLPMWRPDICCAVLCCAVRIIVARPQKALE